MVQLVKVGLLKSTSFLSGGGPFTPASISGLQLWLDMNDADTITTNSDGVVVTSITRVTTVATVETATPHGLALGQSCIITGAAPDAYNGLHTNITDITATSFSFSIAGSPSTPATSAPIMVYPVTPTISSVLDKSGNSNNATQSVNTRKFLLVTDPVPQDRYSYAQGNIAGQLSFASPIALTSFTIMGVFAITSVGVNQTIIGSSSGNAYFRIGTTGSSFFIISDDSTSATLTDTSFFTDRSYQVYEFVFDGTTLTTRINGLETGSTAAFAGKTFTFNKLGARSTVTEPLRGNFAEFVIYNTVPTDPELEQLRSYLSEWRPGAWYIDPVEGLDTNMGWTDESPMSSFEDVRPWPLYAGDSLLFKRGSVFETSQGIQLRANSPSSRYWRSGTADNRITISSYGQLSAANPLFIGAGGIGENWEFASGVNYSWSSGYDPLNLFLVSEDGKFLVENKYTRIDSTDPDDLSNGEWLYDGVGSVYLASDPTDPNTLNIYAPLQQGQPDTYNGNGLLANFSGHPQDYYDVYDIDMRMFPIDGFNIGSGSTNWRLYNPYSYYNSNDGYGIFLDGNVDIYNITSIGNGQQYNVGGAPGDGISFHNTSTGSITGGTISGNTKTGIGNVNTTQVQAFGVHIHSNVKQVDFNGSVGGKLEVAYCLIEHISDGLRCVSNVNGEMTLNNNTIVNTSPQGSIIGVLDATTVQNNIIYGFDTTSSVGLSANSSCDADSNCFFSNTTNFSGGVTPTNSVTADPLFVSSTDLSLQAGSPCIDVGLDLGYTQDILGVTVPQGSAPDLGCYEYFVPSLLVDNLSNNNQVTENIVDNNTVIQEYP